MRLPAWGQSDKNEIAFLRDEAMQNSKINWVFALGIMSLLLVSASAPTVGAQETEGTAACTTAGTAQRSLNGGFGGEYPIFACTTTSGVVVGLISTNMPPGTIYTVNFISSSGTVKQVVVN